MKGSTISFESTAPSSASSSWSAFPEEVWTFPNQVIQRRLKLLEPGDLPEQPVKLQARDDANHYRPPRKRDEAPFPLQEYHGTGVGAVYCGCGACSRVRAKTDLRGWVIL